MTAPGGQPATVGVSRDFCGPDGSNVWGDIRLDRLSEVGLAWRYLDRDVDVLRPADIEGLSAVVLAAPAVDPETFAGPGPFPRLFARFGVGYDAVDLDACTQHDVLVTITPDGARRPVATAALTLILAASHHLVVKDRLVRTGDWQQRTSWMGRGLSGRTVGLVGLGSTGGELLGLLAPFGVQALAADPYCPSERAASLGARLVGLEELFTCCDVVVVMAALTPQTRHLIGADLLTLMRPDALLVNVARGPIIDEQALAAGLLAGRPAQAALDVFESEPPPTSSPLLGMDSVLLAPHSLAWTDEMAAGNGDSVMQAVLDVHAGRLPRHVVNRDVLSRPEFSDWRPAR